MNWYAVMGIIVGFGICVVIPLVAILSEHQRKMARLIHGMSEDDETERVLTAIRRPALDSGEGLREEIQGLRSEIAELRRELGVRRAE